MNEAETKQVASAVAAVRALANHYCDQMTSTQVVEFYDLLADDFGGSSDEDTGEYVPLDPVTE
jgi:hypothetical protein